MPESGINKRIDEVIGHVGLEVKRDSFIKGLSRGMKQRLGIARAVIHKPKVLLLDEPASGLDPKSRHDLRNLLLSLRDEGATILISSHILSELEGFCTSIGVMEKGKMIRSGRIEQIVADESKFRVIRVAWVGDADVPSMLATIADVSQVQAEGKEATFHFTGNDEALAKIPMELASRGAAVLSFGEVKQTVEEIYMKLSKNEVM
jgi:ABC-2 type transport system ATP-binding protein